MNHFESYGPTELETKDDTLRHVICESGRNSPDGYVVAMCGFHVKKLGGKVEPSGDCIVCKAIIDDPNGSCRSCKQSQLVVWGKAIGIAEDDMRYDAERDILLVTYTPPASIEPTVTQKENNA